MSIVIFSLEKSITQRLGKQHMSKGSMSRRKMVVRERTHTACRLFSLYVTLAYWSDVEHDMNVERSGLSITAVSLIKAFFRVRLLLSLEPRLTQLIFHLA